MGLLDSIIPGAGLATGFIGAIGKLFGAGKANRKLQQLQEQDPVYKANPISAQRLGLAKTLFNARMPGAATIERGIYGNQANAISNINRNATDSSQALALASGVQGQSNNAFSNLGIEEQQNQMNNLNNLNSAYAGEINEGDKVFNDETRRFNDKVQIQGAKNENNQNVWGSISNAGFSLADLGINGGFSGMFKKKSPYGSGIPSNMVM